MAYDYQKERSKVFTEEGQVAFLAIRDNMNHYCDQAGAVGFLKATDGTCSDGWLRIACVDRLVELGEFECVYDGGMTQDRIYRRK